MKKVNVGIVGSGGMGKIHASAYMRNPGACIKSVCSVSRELVQEFADGEWDSVQYSEGRIKNQFAL